MPERPSDPSRGPDMETLMDQVMPTCHGVVTRLSPLLLVLGLGAPGLSQSEPVFDLVSVRRLTHQMGGLAAIPQNGKFGWSVTSLGDLDGNGVVDLAVGAIGSQTPSIFDPDAPGFVWILFLAPDGTVIGFEQIGDGQGGFTGDLADTDDFGSAVASPGDLDGDNVADLVVGARRDDDGGTNRGALWVLFLNDDGTVKSHTKISDLEGGFGGTLEDQERFGHALTSIGDLDGDGVVDLAVGAPQDGAGAVWLLLMNSDGTVKAEAKIDADGAGLPVGEDAWFGSALAHLGDLTGDGTFELAVGAERSQLFGAPTGAVWVLSVTTTGTVSGFVPILENHGGFLGDLDDEDRFGSSLAAVGDLDGNGVVDLAVGAMRDDPAFGQNNAGGVWILSLEADGTVLTWEKLGDADALAIPGPLVPAGAFLGASVASLGDLDGDGRVDLAVGSTRGVEEPLLGQRGTVRICFSGLQDDLPPIVSDEVNGAQTALTLTTSDFLVSEDADNSGYLDPGEDLNGNGLLDRGTALVSIELAPGATNLVVNEEPYPSLGFVEGEEEALIRVELGVTGQAGLGTLEIEDGAGNVTAVAVSLGGPNQTLLGEVISDSKVSATSGGFDGPLDANDNFGAAAAWLGDMDDDGRPEVAIGAPGDDGGLPNSGGLWILSVDDDDQVEVHKRIGNYQSVLVGTLGQGDSFGSGLASLGDLDGDGTLELAVGAMADSSVYILHLHPDATFDSFERIANGLGGFPVGQLVQSDFFGDALAVVGDLDGDGTPELAVGAVGDDDGTFNTGAVWILFLNEDGTVRDVQKISATEGGFAGRLTSGDEFGSGIAALGDVNGDGVPDLAVGASGISGTTVFNGVVWILFLASDGTVVGERLLDDLHPVLNDLDVLNNFGASLEGLGDIDGNGVGDLAVGANEGDSGRGHVAVLLLDATGDVIGHRVIGHMLGEFLGTLETFTEFGSSVGAWWNPDDLTLDLAVGVPEDDDGENQAGAMWLVSLNTAVDTNAPVCSVSVDGSAAAGTAFDDMSTEDTNGNLVLDPGEDLNANERIDVDRGIASITLGGDAENLVLEVEPFSPSAGEVAFTVTLGDVGSPGSGSVVVTDGAGNETMCAVELEPTHCFLVIGDAQGSDVFNGNGHEFTTQLGGIVASHVVSMGSIPTFVLPGPDPWLDPTASSRGPGGQTATSDWMNDGVFTVQVLLWEPDALPANPEQFSTALHVSLLPDGFVRVRPYGAQDEITIGYELDVDAEGRTTIRFPFVVPGCSSRGVGRRQGTSASGTGLLTKSTSGVTSTNA